VEVPSSSPKNPKRLERSAAVERLERLERASVLGERSVLNSAHGELNRTIGTPKTGIGIKSKTWLEPW